MGIQCSSLSEYSELQLIKSLHHPTFGAMYHMHNDQNNTEIAILSHSIPQADITSYLQAVQMCKKFDIPTLVTIIDFECKQSTQICHENLELNHCNKSISKLKCSQYEKCIDNAQVLLSLPYYPPEYVFEEVLSTRIKEYNKQLSKNCTKNQLMDLSRIKMCDYMAIDILNDKDRKLINIFYQQIEILRMIDHIVGAVYYLHHFNMKHNGIRPNNIIVDLDGKHLLVDCYIFRRMTNLQLLNLELLNKINTWTYLAPEQLIYQDSSSEKIDIFCIALLAIHMCLLEQPIIYIRNKRQNKLQWMPKNITKYLIQIKNKYSEALVNILTKMLQYNIERRIGFNELIDQLQNLININLHSFNQLYQQKNNNTFDISGTSRLQNDEFHNQNINSHLFRQLENIQSSYQKIMNSRKGFRSQMTSHEEIHKDEIRLLNKLKSISQYQDKIGEGFGSNSNYISQQHKVSRNKQVNKNSSDKNHKKYISQGQVIQGKDLYEMYVQQYNSLRKSRPIKR